MFIEIIMNVLAEKSQIMKSHDQLIKHVQMQLIAETTMNVCQFCGCKSQIMMKMGERHVQMTDCTRFSILVDGGPKVQG